MRTSVLYTTDINGPRLENKKVVIIISYMF